MFLRISFGRHRTHHLEQKSFTKSGAVTRFSGKFDEHVHSWRPTSCNTTVRLLFQAACFNLVFERVRCIHQLVRIHLAHILGMAKLKRCPGNRIFIGRYPNKKSSGFGKGAGAGNS